MEKLEKKKQKPNKIDNIVNSPIVKDQSYLNVYLRLPTLS